MLTRLSDALGAFLPKLTNPLMAFTAPDGHGLYPDNQQGNASFASDPLVKSVDVVHTDADLTYVKGQMETNGEGTGQFVVDVRTGERHDWNGSAWIVSADALDNYQRAGRLCFSPITAKVLHRDLNGVVRQLLS